MCPDSPADVKLGGIKMSGAQTQGPALTTVFKNISEYAPVWPRLEDGELKGLKGYLKQATESAPGGTGWTRPVPQYSVELLDL